MLNVSFCNLQIYNFFGYIPIKYRLTVQKRPAASTSSVVQGTIVAIRTHAHTYIYES